MIIFRKKLLVNAIATSMAMAISLSATASDKKIGDLSIYKAAEPSAPTLTMMLDTSGSMQYIDIEGQELSPNDCNNSGGQFRTMTKPFSYDDPNDNVRAFTINVRLNYCNLNNNTYFDRISLLKNSLLELITSTDEINPDTRIAIGSFGVRTSASNMTAGQIILPARKLDANHRQDIINAVSTLSASGGTPTANALAEAGAYMMGTGTEVPPQRVTYWQQIGYYAINRNSRQRMVSYCQGYNSILKAGLQGDNGNFIDYTQDCSSYGNWRGINGTLNIDERVYNNLSGSWDIYRIYRGPLVGNTSGSVYSGFGQSAASTKAANGLTYSQGAEATECAGNGIYLLTDGTPNTSSNGAASELMNVSLNESSTGLSVGSCDLLSDVGTASAGSNGWGCMGNYARVLRNENNPSGVEIKVATAGLGVVFGGLPSNGEIEDCDGSIDPSNPPSADARNLCRLGEKGYDLGNGGFTHITGGAHGGKQLIDSIVNFIADLDSVISTTPSGTITIPKDPLSANNIQPFAYLPMLEPKVDDAYQIWPGNLKKYGVEQGTLFGQNDLRLYVKPNANAKFPYALNHLAKDLWMGSDNFVQGGDITNNAVNAGGVYAKLKAPSTTQPNSIRSVFVEDLTVPRGTQTHLVKIGVNTANGTSTLIGFDDLNDPIYNIIAKAHLLNFLGFDVSTKVADYQGMNAGQQRAKLISQLTIPANETKVLGGVVHSKPELVSYGGKFNAPNKDEVNNTTGAATPDGIVDNDAGQITNEESDRKDYLMFGSMDGSLHLVKAETGEENLAIIPLKMIKEQLEALRKNAEGAPIGKPVFGVDAPWASNANYQINLDRNEIVADEVYAYGGLRMGGVGFYGLNLTNKDAPTLLFSINRGKNNQFKRLGQTWSKPLIAKIRTTTGTSSNGLDNNRDVIVFGGGYDMCYESANFKLSIAVDASDSTDDCNKKKSTYGNAVYMVDAKTGELLASWSGVADGGSNNEVISEMTNSIVGGITGLDRNDNGAIDHLYFSDLGGQVFRIDLREDKPLSQLTKRVVKVFDANEGVTQTTPYRFYERPIVSFYRDPTGGRFATVSVASGNRSSPLASRAVDEANRVYAIFDRDIAKQGLYGDTFSVTSKDINSNDLIKLPPTSANRETLSKLLHESINPSTRAVTPAQKQGWYYPLDKFDGNGNVPNVKAVGEGIIIGGIYYMTTYSPDMNYGTKSQCSADVTGGSERELYCLPYGVCNQKDKDGNYLSDNGTGGYTRAGKGIQELSIGPISSINRQSKVFTDLTSFSEAVKPDGTHDSNVGNTDDESSLKLGQEDIATNGDITKNGMQTAPKLEITPTFRAVAKRWYEIENY